MIPSMWTASQEEDGDGHNWTVPKDHPSAKIECWWNRTTKPFKGKVLKAEHFMLRQENPGEKPDIIFLTHGQVYGLIHALNSAVMET